MSANVVNHILTQINQQPTRQEIKKLLFLKLEAELNASRCVITESAPIQKDASWVEIVE